MSEKFNGQGNEPLKGIRILDLTHFLAGPYGGMLLGDLGAEVIKVEPPNGGDSTRVSPPYFYGHDSAYFWGVNRNKKSVPIDLKSPEGLEVFYQLSARSDVVLDNFRYGVLERLKIDYENLKLHNPQIICCSISAFGSTGPYRDFPSYDLIAQAMGGNMSITGEPGGPPMLSGIQIGDLMGGLLGVHGILAAIIARHRTGEGQRLEVSLLDSQLYLLTYLAQYYFYSGKIPVPVGSGHQFNVVYRAFKTKDIYIVVTAHIPPFWEKFCHVLKKPEWITDPRFHNRAARFENKDVLDQMVEDILKEKTGDEWIQELRREGVPTGPVNSLHRILNDPHIYVREMVVEMEGPRGEKVKTIGNPLKMEGTPIKKFSRPPRLGEHTRQILSEVLGYGDEKIESLSQKGIVKAI